MSEQLAFPHTETTVKMGTEFNSYHPGLTKRDWFAGMAMQGILANPWLMQKFSEGTTSVAVQLKVKDFSEQQAEKML